SARAGPGNETATGKYGLGRARCELSADRRVVVLCGARPGRSHTAILAVAAKSVRSQGRRVNWAADAEGVVARTVGRTVDGLRRGAGGGPNLLGLVAQGVERAQQWRQVLEAPRTYLLGREATADLAVPWDAHISRRPARLNVNDGRVSVETLPEARN